MDITRAFEKSFSTGCYFAFCGAWWCALCLSLQSLLAAWFIWVSDYNHFSTVLIEDWGYKGGLRVLSLSAVIIGSSLGFVGSILWFFVVGFYQQTKDGFSRKESFWRTLKAALWGMTICGWCAAVTGVSAYFIIKWFWPNLATQYDSLSLFFAGLLGGNLLGCIIGVFAPNLIERMIQAMPRFIRLKV